MICLFGLFMVPMAMVLVAKGWRLVEQHPALGRA